MKNLSGIVLTHNNERTIKRCVKSMKGVVEELIVIDDYSTDDTVKIIKKIFPKVRVYQRKLNKNFASQRNFALTKPKNEWVLMIDSDEEITSELKKEIKELENPKYDAYKSRRDNDMMGDFYPGDSGRPILLKKSLEFQGSLHEQVKNVKMGFLKQPLLHHCWTGMTDFIKSMNNYSTLEAKKWIEEERKFGSFKLLGIAFLMPIYTFLLHYVKHKKYRGGIKGFMYSISHASIWWFKIMKYIEMKNNKNR